MRFSVPFSVELDGPHWRLVLNEETTLLGLELDPLPETINASMRLTLGGVLVLLSANSSMLSKPLRASFEMTAGPLEQVEIACLNNVAPLESDEKVALTGKLTVRRGRS